MSKIFNFLPTKAEEESGVVGGSSTEVEIREMGPGTRTVHYIDQWKIRKELTQTDLVRRGKLVLPQEFKAAVEENILCYLPRNAVEDVLAGGHAVIRIKDVDYETYHDDMTITRLPSGQSTSVYYIQGHWKRDFVNRRNLLPGQVIGLCWNVAENCLDFSVLQPLGAR